MYGKYRSCSKCGNVLCGKCLPLKEDKYDEEDYICTKCVDAEVEPAAAEGEGNEDCVHSVKHQLAQKSIITEIENFMKEFYMYCRDNHSRTSELIDKILNICRISNDVQLKDFLLE